MELATFASHRTCISTDWPAVLYLASSGSLASSWSPGVTHGHWKFFHHRIVQVKGRALNRAANWFPEPLQVTNCWPKSLRTLAARLIGQLKIKKTIGKFWVSKTKLSKTKWYELQHWETRWLLNQVLIESFSWITRLLQLPQIIPVKHHHWY